MLVVFISQLYHIEFKNIGFTFAITKTHGIILKKSNPRSTMKQYTLAKLPKIGRRINQISATILLPFVLFMTSMLWKTGEFWKMLPILLPMFLFELIALSGYWPRCWHPGPPKFENIVLSLSRRR
jgi:hypothetical protein